MNPEIDQVLAAISVLFSAQDSSASQRREASKWLEQYQKTKEAWNITAQLFQLPNASIETYIFAAQTFRQKIELDILDLDASSLVQLRDSLIELLHRFKTKKNISTQLCLSLADLAIQMPGWENPVQYMIQMFKDPTTIGILLEFLQVLPEELFYNTKINLEQHEVDQRIELLLGQNAHSVLQLLFHILQQAGQAVEAKVGILSCLCSWIRSGTISEEDILNYSLVSIAFEALQTLDTFDVGVDLVCEVVLASSRIGGGPKEQHRLQLINSIVPYLKDLIPFLRENSSDGDVARGLCRIYVDAAEGYAPYIAKDLAKFQSILEGLLICAANEDLDVVKITINAWFILSEELIGPEKTHLRIGFLPVYQSLVSIILQKMQYPEDLTTFTAQERDEFRDFRHDVGDVLKDCVKVLGQVVALQAPYNLLKNIFQASQSSTNASIRWQEVEAPLFSLRAMCREISLNESTFIPEIMSMLPRLPDHPKIQYAAILVIGRYAQWTNEHPEMIAYQLDFVSKGFRGESETTIAAAHTFRDLCKFCSKHLIQYIEQLQPFYMNSLQLVQEQDRKEMSEAISHLIAAVPVDQLGQALNMFCVPVAQKIHSMVEQDIHGAEIEKLKELNGSVDELGYLLKFIRVEIPSTQPHPTVQLLEQMWPIFSKLFEIHGSKVRTSESLARFFRNVLESTKTHFAPLLPKLIPCLLSGLENTKLSCYIWVCAKVVRVCGQKVDYQSDINQLIQSITQIVFQMVQKPSPDDPEPEMVIEEYHYLLSMYVDACPHLFLNSSLLNSTMECAIYCLGSASDGATQSVLRFIIDVFELGKQGSEQLARPVINLMEQYGQPLITSLFKGLIYTFSKVQGLVADVGEIVFLFSQVIGTQRTIQIINSSVEQFPINEMSLELKSQFMNKMQNVIEGGQVVKISSCIKDFAAAYARRNLINSRK